MTREVEIDGRELLAVSEEAPLEAEIILEMMIDAEAELVYDDEPELLQA